MTASLDRGILLDAKPALDRFFEKLTIVKHFYRWEADDAGSILGDFVYLNIHDVFDDSFVCRDSPLQAVAFPVRFDAERELIDYLGLTFEEGQIIASAAENDTTNPYFSRQVRNSLLIELGVEDNNV